MGLIMLVLFLTFTLLGSCGFVAGLRPWRDMTLRLVWSPYLSCIRHR